MTLNNWAEILRIMEIEDNRDRDEYDDAENVEIDDLDFDWTLVLS